MSARDEAGAAVAQYAQRLLELAGARPEETIAKAAALAQAQTQLEEGLDLLAARLPDGRDLSRVVDVERITEALQLGLEAARALGSFGPAFPAARAVEQTQAASKLAYALSYWQGWTHGKSEPAPIERAAPDLERVYTQLTRLVTTLDSVSTSWVDQTAQPDLYAELRAIRRELLAARDYVETQR